MTSVTTPHSRIGTASIPDTASIADQGPVNQPSRDTLVVARSSLIMAVNSESAMPATACARAWLRALTMPLARSPGIPPMSGKGRSGIPGIGIGMS
jgi:hypothetical protein